LQKKSQARAPFDKLRAGSALHTIANQAGEEMVNGIPTEPENPLARKPLYLLGEMGFKHPGKDKILELPW